MGNYGKYATDGSVEVEATECILTGRALAAPYDNTVRYPARGGRFFRILSSQHHRVTDEMLADWKNGGETTPAPVVSKSKALPVGEVKNDN